MEEGFASRLRQAMRSGDIAALERLKAERPDIHENGWPGLPEAIGDAPIGAIRWLLENGADPNQPADDGFPALHCAIDRNAPDRAAVVALLLDFGADVNQRGMNDWTPLHRAAAVPNGAFDVLRVLLDSGADRTAATGIDNHATPEQEARLLGRVQAADFIRDFPGPACIGGKRR